MQNAAERLLGLADREIREQARTSSSASCAS